MRLNEVFEFARTLRERLKTVNVVLLNINVTEEEEEDLEDKLCDIPSTFDVSKHSYYIPMAIVEVRNGVLICRETGENTSIHEVDSEELELGDLFYLCSHLEEYHKIDF